VRTSRSRLPIVAAVVAAAVTLGGGVAPAATDWTSVPVPAIPIILEDVSADSATDAWAVGAGGHTVVHFDGAAWKLATAPQISGSNFQLFGVAALSPTDVWVVGEDATLGRTHTAHWDGSSWRFVPVRNASTLTLNAMAAVRGTTTLWAAGSRLPGNDRAVMAYFDGAAWHRMAVPGRGTLNAVAVHRANDVWAVGEDCLYPRICPIIDRWNGTRWRAMRDVRAKFELPKSVAVVPGSNHVWVVGASAVGDTYQPFAEFFGGSRWTRTPIPRLSHGGGLDDVVAVNATDVWAVGEVDHADGFQHKLIEHWDGRAWTRASLPPSLDQQNRLNAITRVPGNTETWAAGWSAGVSLAMQILHHP
jgi:hypothetical protein